VFSGRFVVNDRLHGATSNQENAMKEVFAITTRTTTDGTEQSFWDRIGVAFECKDGSLDLKLNLVPADLGSTSINYPRPASPR
jgi:hypothetical protein